MLYYHLDTYTIDASMYVVHLIIINIREETAKVPITNMHLENCDCLNDDIQYPNDPFPVIKWGEN